MPNLGTTFLTEMLKAAKLLITFVAVVLAPAANFCEIGGFPFLLPLFQ